MPFLNIYTNVSRDKTTKELNIELSKLMASTLGKPEGYCSVRLVSDENLSFGGTFDPCAYGELMSIGRIGVEENKKFSNEIMSLLEARLGVPPTRFYITFNDAKPQDVGFNKSTFHGIL